MRIHEAPQGTEAWHRARIGVATASCFHEILTPAKLEPSKSAAAYARRLVAEWLIGAPCEKRDATGFVERGKELEPRARAAYALEYGVDVREVGLCLTDDGRAGCSPDGLVGEDGGLEIKVPGAPAHLGYLLDPASLFADYRLQVLGSLWVTRRAWWDLWSWEVPESGIPAVRFRVERIDYAEAFARFDEAMRGFCDAVDEIKRRAVEAGAIPFEERERERVEREKAESRALFATPDHGPAPEPLAELDDAKLPF